MDRLKEKEGERKVIEEDEYERYLKRGVLKRGRVVSKRRKENRE